MAFLLLRQSAARHHHHHHQTRTFINARIKWVRDPYIDSAVEKEKNLKPLLSIKSLILSQPSKSLPLQTIAALKPQLGLPTAAAKFLEKYPQVFKVFLPPKPLSLPHVKLTPKALSIHNDETLLMNLSHYKKDVAERLAKLLMLTRGQRLPLYVIENLKFDLGLPHDYRLSLLSEFPDYFEMCDMGFRDSNGSRVFGLELVSWRDDLAVSVMEKRDGSEGTGGGGRSIRFPVNLPSGFDLEKKVKEWVDEWQDLPYISPYEDAFHLAPNSDQAEKWTVGVIHELLQLLVSKKTERDGLFSFGDYLGFGTRFKKALVHHPGIFYVSNKIRTQTVVLREAYRKYSLVEKHVLIGMRHKYVGLMNTVLRRGKPIQVRFGGRRRKGEEKKLTKRRKEKRIIENKRELVYV